MTTMVSTPVSPTIQVFTEEPGSSFTGMVPAYVEGIGKMENGTIAAGFRLLNEISLKSATLDKILSNGELCCITYDKGEMKAIAVYNLWVEKFVKEKASGVLLSCGGAEFTPKENVIIQQLRDESYDRMARLCMPLLKS